MRKWLKSPHAAERNVGYGALKQTELLLRPSSPISNFSFLISHFSFLIFRFPRVSAFRQTPPSTRLGNRGQSCLSTDRRAPTSRTSPPHYTAYMRCRFVKLSDHICQLRGWPGSMLLVFRPLLSVNKRLKGAFLLSLCRHDTHN